MSSGAKYLRLENFERRCSTSLQKQKRAIRKSRARRQYQSRQRALIHQNFFVRANSGTRHRRHHRSVRRQISAARPNRSVVAKCFRKSPRLGVSKRTMTVIKINRHGPIRPSRADHQVHRLVAVYIARRKLQTTRWSDKPNRFPAGSVKPQPNPVLGIREIRPPSLNTREIQPRISVKIGNRKRRSRTTRRNRTIGKISSSRKPSQQPPGKQRKAQNSAHNPDSHAADAQMPDESVFGQ